jgi:hypothetical protein
MLREFLIASLSLCNQLLGPDTSDPLLRVDIRHLNAGHFRSLHAVQTAAIAGVYAAINPRLRDSLAHGLREIFQADDSADRLFAEVASQVPPDLVTVAPIVWARCVEITNAPHRPVEGPYSYAMFLGSVAGGSFADLKTKLGA